MAEWIGTKGRKRQRRKRHIYDRSVTIRLTVADRMIQFVQRALRPSLMEVNDQSSPSFLTWDNVVFIGRFLAVDQGGYDNYKSLANRYRDRYSFGIHSKAAKDKSTIRCRNNLDEEEHTLDELWRVVGFENFVRLCTEPLIPEITRRNEERYSSVCLYEGVSETRAERIRL